VNPHPDQLIDAEIMHAMRAQISDVFRGNSVYAHRDQLFGIGMFVNFVHTWSWPRPTVMHMTEISAKGVYGQTLEVMISEITSFCSFEL
jgi:hypothetical protein